MTPRYVVDRSEMIAEFVARMIPHAHRGFGACRAIGIVREDDELIAGIVYHQHNPEAGTICISGAALPGHQWLTRETLRVMHSYPFVNCRCQMVVMLVPADSERLLKQLARGYKFILLPRAFGKDRDGVYCYLTREMWLDNKVFQRLHRGHQSKAA